MRTTLLDNFCAEEMLKAMHEYKIHLKVISTIPRMWRELEAIGLEIHTDKMTATDSQEYCRYSKEQEFCMVYRYPFSRYGEYVEDAKVIIKQFIIPAKNPRYPDRHIFEMFLEHGGRLRTCELQNGARWW